MKRKRQLSIVLALCGLFLIVSITGYILNFRSINISDNSADWGAFGSYIGGISSMIINIANLVVVVYISMLISKNDDKRFLNQIIHELHTEINTNLDKLNFKKYSSENAAKTHEYLVNIAYQHSYLFQEGENAFSKMCFDLSGCIVAISQYQKPYVTENNTEVDITLINDQYILKQHNQESLTIDEKVNYEMLGTSHFKYQMYRHKLISFIRATISNKPTKGILTENITKDKARARWSDYNSRRLEYIREAYSDIF